MKNKRSVYLKLNLMSIFFIVASFISVTMAWFAYSGLSSAATEVGIRAWHIELEKNGVPVSNDILIPFLDIYPGMVTLTETVKIKNLGDSDAAVKYKIVSARILGDVDNNYVVDDINLTSSDVETILETNFPFKIDISLDKQFVYEGGEEATFTISISWPLDSGDDVADTYWGTEAYKFLKSEEQKKALDSEYEIKPSISISINLTAEQYLAGE